MLIVKVIHVLIRHYLLITWTKNPPDNMNVMRVTEAKVVAFFTSMNAAPIAKPKP